MLRRAVFSGLVTLLASLAACGGDDPDDGDAGPPFCPVGAPDTGTPCPVGVGICTYEGMNRDCPPLVGSCHCADGGWVCEPPECTTCNESCNGECCNLDDVCRATAEGLGQACGPPGDATTPLYGDCGHESDCAGLEPICSPICGTLCCTFDCDLPEDCPEGTCGNGVCTPPDDADR